MLPAALALLDRRSEGHPFDFIPDGPGSELLPSALAVALPFSSERSSPCLRTHEDLIDARL